MNTLSLDDQHFMHGQRIRPHSLASKYSVTTLVKKHAIFSVKEVLNPV